MIESSLLRTRIRLLQCYDWKPTALCVSQNGYFQSPCSLWEQEFRSSTDIRQPSTVNRVLVSCSGVIGNSPLLVCHTERRPQSPCSMWEQELNRYPSIVNRQPSTVFNQVGMFRLWQYKRIWLRAYVCPDTWLPIHCRPKVLNKHLLTSRNLWTSGASYFNKYWEHPK